MASWTKDFLLEFIELYKSLEPLWHIKSKDYYNKTKKNQCYNILLDLVLTVEPSATRDTVTKKINNLRSCFRKEYKKVQASMAASDSTGLQYVPKLWYYTDLMFLKDQEEPLLQTTSSVNIKYDGGEISPHTSASSVTSATSGIKRRRSTTSLPATPPPTTPSPSPSPPPKTIRILEPGSINQRIPSERSETLYASEAHDDITAYALYIGAQMRKLQPVLQCKLKFDIQSLLCKYELQNIESTTPGTSS